MCNNLIEKEMFLICHINLRDQCLKGYMNLWVGAPRSK